MKNIEDYVCILEQAKRLKDLGVEQDSLYWWNGTGIGMVTLNNEKADWSENILQYKSYSAFTYQEIIEILGTIKTESYYKFKKTCSNCKHAEKDLIISGDSRSGDSRLEWGLKCHCPVFPMLRTVPVNHYYCSEWAFEDIASIREIPIKIDIYDFGGSSAQTYVSKCECGKEICVSFQKDSSPEYYIDVFVKCECGKSVKVRLPVN